MSAVSLRSVRKSFGSTEVVHGVDISIADGEFCVLVGPSGCGKSTLLRMIAGLEEISAGEIAIGARVVNALRPKERDIAMVFQNYALYPHMTVFDNMAFSLKMARVPIKDIDRRTGAVAGNNIHLVQNMQNAHFFDPSTDKAIEMCKHRQNWRCLDPHNLLRFTYSFPKA